MTSTMPYPVGDSAWAASAVPSAVNVGPSVSTLDLISGMQVPPLALDHVALIRDVSLPPKRACHCLHLKMENYIAYRKAIYISSTNFTSIWR